MDASTTQPGVSIRRTGKRRIRWVLLLVMAIIVGKRWSTDEVDVDPALIQSGSYQVASVNPDGSLKLVVRNAKPNEIDVRWLGIEIHQPKEAADWISSMVAPSHPIQLRLDRRRLDEEGNLQAYFLKNDLLLNAELIRMGFATEATHPSDFAPIARQIRRATSLNATPLSRSK